MKLHHLLFSLSTFTLLASFPYKKAYAEIKLQTNQATIIKLAKPADTVIIGNPLIADVVIQNKNTLVLTAKAFGITNLVALGADGSTILTKSLIISRHTASSVRVYRQAQLQTLSCTPMCEGSYRSASEKESDTTMSEQKSFNHQ